MRQELGDGQPEEIRDLVEVVKLHATIAGQNFTQPCRPVPSILGEAFILLTARREQGADVLNEQILSFELSDVT